MSGPSKPMRVLLAIGSLSGGGSERQLIGLLKGLDRNVVTPHLYLVHDGGELRDEVPDDVPVHVYWNQRAAPRWNWPGRILHQQSADLRGVIEHWNIDCVYDRNFHTTLLTGPATRGRGGRPATPRISTVVSDPETDLARQERRFVSWKRRRLRSAYQSASRVVAVSEGVRHAVIRDFGVSEQQVVTIHSPIDLPRIDRLRDEPLENAWDPGRFHIVGAGRLLAAKGWLELLEAVRRLRDDGHNHVQAHVLGEGPLRAELQRTAAQHHLQDHFVLHGFQSNPYNFFRQANVVCHPSHYEGLPNVLLEAIACETPVVATDCRWGPSEILEQGRWGRLVPVGDAAELAKALEATMLEAMPAQQLAAAREHVKQRFGPTRAVRAIEALLREVIPTTT